MKTTKYFLILLITSILTSCSTDDNPVPVNEEEVITTLKLTLTPQGGGTEIVFQTQDLDGDGPNAPVITVSSLNANTTYIGSIQLLNELENPADNITLEVEEEDEEHQLFYTLTGNSNIMIDYADQDSNGNPVGLNIILSTGDAGNNTLTVTLRHEPNKDATGVSAGDITNAGGETDIQTTFNFTVQ